MVAATTATDVLLTKVTSTRRIELADLTAAHRELMRNDPADGDYAGRVRDMQNWIGGSKYSPRDALYVPPPPETVDEYLQDLIGYANRDKSGPPDPRFRQVLPTLCPHPDLYIGDPELRPLR